MLTFHSFMISLKDIFYKGINIKGTLQNYTYTA